MGSIDFQAAARSVLIVGRVKDEPEMRVICHVKSSLAPEGDAIAFRLDKEKGFHWIGKYDISAEDLLSGDGRGQKIRSAKEFLKEILENGSMEQAKIAEEQQEVTGIVVNYKPQLAKSVRKGIRKDVYYINKYGLQSHLKYVQEERSNYLEHLFGLINYSFYSEKKYHYIIK